MARPRKLAVSLTMIAAWLLIAPGAAQSQWTTAGSDIHYNLGKVGIGTTVPANNLHVVVTNGVPLVPFKMESTGADSITGISLKNDARNWHVRVDGTDGDKFKIFDATTGYRFTIDTAGNVGIGTETPTSKLSVAGNVNVVGDLTATGNLAAKYQDLAEWVPASEPLAPGTVVVLNREKNNEVMKSAVAYDTGVAGVISAQPGILLGERKASDVKVATIGRVKVRVDATRSPIRVGDLLVTGWQPGTAMKSEPLLLGDVSLHRPGTLIGKALEPLGSGEGEILVLLSLQ